MNLTGCEQCFATIPLYEFAKDILTDEEIVFARAQSQKNQGRLQLV
jgi:hypothetical protein